MKIRVLGISGSPRKNGNTDILVHHALRGAMALEEVETEFIGIAGKEIHPCIHCGVCHKQDKCTFTDDFQDIYHKMLSADGIILGSPVYYGIVSAQCKALMDRCYFGSMRSVAEKKKNPLRLKVGGAIAVAGGRHAGQEATLQAIVNYFFICDMLPVGMNSPHSQLGAAGTAWEPATVGNDKWDHWQIKRSTSALEVAWMLGRKIATVTKIVREGMEKSGLDVPDAPYGIDMPQTPYT